MDVKIPPTSWFKTHRKRLIGGGVALSIALSFMFKTPTVSSTEIVLVTVNNGDIHSSTTGVGKIESLKLWQISAIESGQLVEVVKNVGDHVQQGDVILKLNNNKISQLAQTLSQDIELLETALASTKVRLQAEQDERRNQSKKNKLRLNSAAQTLAAITELVNKGIMPKLKLTQEQTTVAEAQLDVELSQALLLSSQQIADAEIMLQQGKIRRTQSELANVRARITDLDVRSPITGILQFVSDKYGARIDEGEALAQVSDTTRMKASFILPEQDANQIYLGQAVSLDTSQGKLAATISLIKPTIKNGTVEIEASFIDEAPSWVKPDLPLRAVINGHSVYTGLYIKKPSQINANSEATLYKMVRNSKTLVPVLVKFGDQIEQYIAIQSGLNPGDMVVFSSSVTLSGQQINISN